jgi:galactokinase
MSIGAASKLELSHSSPTQRAVALYRSAFGESPSFVAFAPGRVNLIGDHTDYCEGLVFPAALSDGCACAVGPRSGEFAAVSAEIAGRPVIDATATITPGDLAGEPGWMRYAAGTFESMRTRFAPNAGGANIAVASDVPPGSGLSSSASLEVSIATALEHLWGVTIDPVDKAKACQSAEHEYAGAPCGLMDQLVSVMGKRGCAIRIDCRDATTTAVPMPPADEAVFVIFDSAVSHANDDGGYAARRAACESSLPKLGVRALRDVAPDRLGSLPDDLTPVEIDAVRHVVSENARVEAFTSLLPQAKLAEAGALMNESHRSLSETYRVSCPEVDTLAEIVRSQPGVYGARMTGGGFGGWIVSLMKADALERAANSVREAYKAATGLDTAHRVVEAGDGAKLVR